MKKKSWIIPAALAVPTGVVVARTIMNKAKPNTSAPAISWTKDESDKYAHNLSEMIKIPTISKSRGEDYSDFIKLQDKMAELFPLTFSTLEKHDIDGNLLRRWPGRNPDAPAVLFMGHQDVVPVNQAGWTRDPFSGDIADGIIWGRGAMDCKSTVCCEFSAVEELLEQGFVPPCDVWLSSSVNEENSGGGAEQAVDYLYEKSVKLRFVMDEGGAIVDNLIPGLKNSCAAIGVVEKGFCDVKFTAKGSGGHASTPNKNTPLVRLGKFMAYVDKKQPFKAEMNSPIPEMFDSIAPYLTFPLRALMSNQWLFSSLTRTALSKLTGATRAFVQTTAAFTMSEGSDASNVLPDEAYVICNVRPSPHQNADESIGVLRDIAKKFDIETEIIKQRDASHVTPTNSEEMAYLKKCLNACLPDAVVTPYLMTGGTDSRKYEKVCDNILRFTPTRLTSEQLAAMHAANENVGVEAIAEGVKIYRYLIEHLNELS